MEFFDSHAHYDDERFDTDRQEIIDKIYQESVTKVVSSGYSIEGSKRAIEIAQKVDFIYATCRCISKRYSKLHGKMDGAKRKAKRNAKK